MKPDVVYVLHKNGANSHYIALEYLLKRNNIELQYFEFSVLSKAWKALTSFNFGLLKKQRENFSFLSSLLFSTNKIIVLGIAPFDHKLGFLLKLLKHHQVYYHTSWVSWDGSFHPKSVKNAQKDYRVWKLFLTENVRHIFCVTEASKQQLIDNYNLPENRISVVYHSLPETFQTSLEVSKKKNSFLYTGRLVEQKGLEEMLNFFAKHPEAWLTIIGDGKQRKMVEDFASSHPNIKFRSFLKNREELKRAYAEHSYFLLNSKRSKKWEELFGISILEAMSQGTIPIASNHPGPREIITQETGFLFEEHKLAIAVEPLFAESPAEEMSRNCVKRASLFFPEALAPKWHPILEA